MFTIALASFKEVLRKKILILVAVLTFIYLVIFSLIVYYYAKDIGEWEKGSSVGVFVAASQLISVLGFYFSSMLVALLTIMASAGSISSEIESGLIHSVVTRPIRRKEYVLGKYLGIALLIVIYSIFLYTSVILICLIMRLPFLQSLGTPALIKGLVFFLLEPLAILALSIWGSISFKTLANGIVVIAFYILGLIGSMMEQIGVLVKSDTLYQIGIFSSLVSPFDVIYRQMLSVLFSAYGITNPLFGGTTNLSGTTPSKWMTVYVLIYIAGLVLLSVRKFNRKDIA